MKSPQYASSYGVVANPHQSQPTTLSELLDSTHLKRSLQGMVEIRQGNAGRP